MAEADKHHARIFLHRGQLARPKPPTNRQSRMIV